VSVRWVSELVLDGELMFRIGRADDELVAEWPYLCELRSDRRGEQVRFVPSPDGDPRLVAKVRNGLAAALVRHLHGQTTLHASSVAREGRAVVCLGRSGAGKSTLAAYLSRVRALHLLSDDVVAIELREDAVLAVPTEKEHWLEAGALAALGVATEQTGGKAPLVAERVASAPSVIAAAFALALDAEVPAPVTRRLRGREAVAVVVPCLVRFVLDEPEEHIRELALVAELLGRVPLYELRAPRDFRALPATATIVEDALARRG